MSNDHRDAEQCPICGRSLTLVRPVASRAESDGPAPILQRLVRFLYVLPPNGLGRDPVSLGLLDKWVCEGNLCKFTWERVHGDLTRMLKVLTLGPLGVGKSTYIYALSRGEGAFSTAQNGGDWPGLSSLDRQIAVSQTVKIVENERVSYPKVTAAPSPAFDRTPGVGSPSTASLDSLPTEPMAADEVGTSDSTSESLLSPEEQARKAKQTKDRERREASIPATGQEVQAPATKGLLPSNHRTFGLRIIWESDGERRQRFVRVMDMPGEAFTLSQSSIASLVNHAPNVTDAELVLLCLDPRHLDQLREDLPALGLREDITTPRGLVTQRINEVAMLRGGHLQRKAQGHLAVVILKADLLDRLAPDRQPPRRPLEDFDRTDAEATWERLRTDSAEAREWIKQVSPGLVTFAEADFGSVSYHLVSATGCDAEVRYEGRRFPQMAPRRVQDPLQYYLLHRQPTRRATR